jgi:hypothetical protein
MPKNSYNIGDVAANFGNMILKTEVHVKYMIMSINIMYSCRRFISVPPLAPLIFSHPFDWVKCPNPNAECGPELYSDYAGRLNSDLDLSFPSSSPK